MTNTKTTETSTKVLKTLWKDERGSQKHKLKELDIIQQINGSWINFHAKKLATEAKNYGNTLQRDKLVLIDYLVFSNDLEENVGTRYVSI